MTELAKDFSAIVYDTVNGTVLARFPHPKAWWLAQVALSPDSRLLATLDWGGNEGFARVWDLQTRQCLRAVPVPPGSSMAVGKLRFSPDGRVLAIGQSDGRLRLILLATGETQLDIPPPSGNGGIGALAFAPDGRRLLAGYGWAAPGQPFTNLCLWNAQTGEPAGPLVGHRGGVGAVCFLPGSGMAASAGDDETIRLWDLTTRQEIRRLYGHAGTVESLAALRDRNVGTEMFHKLIRCPVELVELCAGLRGHVTCRDGDSLHIQGMTGQRHVDGVFGENDGIIVGEGNRLAAELLSGFGDGIRGGSVRQPVEIGREHNPVIEALAPETKAALSLLEFAEARAELALDVPVLQRPG